MRAPMCVFQHSLRLRASMLHSWQEQGMPHASTQLPHLHI